MRSSSASTDFAPANLGDLIEFAIETGLVEFCHFTREAVVISVEGRVLTFGPEGARTFLDNLFQGWASSAKSVTVPAAATEPAFWLDPVEAGPSTPSLSSEAAAGAAEPSVQDGYVDAVLSLATRLRLIDGYRKDRAAHRIVIKTPATSAEMSYVDTMEYLTGSIMDELRLKAHRA